jgi:hypothetical protein
MALLRPWVQILPPGPPLNLVVAALKKHILAGCGTTAPLAKKKTKYHICLDTVICSENLVLKLVNSFLIKYPYDG